MNHPHKISDVWSKMKEDKGDLIDRSQAYARWTVPAIMPADHSSKIEQTKGNVPTGARLVNHLANKIVDVLFPVSRPFFTVALTPEAKLRLENELGPEQSGKMQEMIRDSTSRLEAVALRKLKLTAYRPQAIMAAKHLIVVGNILLRRMPTGERILYPVDRYGVRRNILGAEYQVVLSDKKVFKTFDEETQSAITAVRPNTKDLDEVELLTLYEKEGTRWKITQEADGIPIGTPMHQNAADYDLLVLAWSLHPGEHYGRGLVEDHATTFHNVDVCTEALLDMTAILADIKFFVRLGSPLAMDIAALNAAPRGSYFPGNADDITVPDMKTRADLSTINDLISKWEGELAAGFLLSDVRDAERVTAAEIRMIANELESAFGGLYSMLAQSWQQREADYAIAQIDFEMEIGEDSNTFEVVVTTGLESLSREGQIDNLRLAVGDLQMMEAVPEDIRGAFNPLRFAKFVFTNRSVDLNAFLNTPEEMRANQEAAMAQAGRLKQQEGQANVQEHAGKAAVDSQQTQ
jgi:hypothetical protein